MAHKKAGGSTALGRDSHGQRLGIKLSDGSFANPGNIIVRQRGTKFRPGKNVKRAGDDSLLATVAGVVKFARRKLIRFNRKLDWANIVNVIPQKE